MSYLVLARKYRPKVFADVVGQEHVIRPLVNSLESGRIAHAFLFAGARGVGKTTVARLLSMALNCRAEGKSRPCGECSSCVEISEGQAVDVFEIDGASNRGINEIRELRETVKYLPSRGDYKVYIIDEVHMLTKEAFNALLKTLEEPPDHVVFIFATTEAHKVLPTILSRCQRYDFRRIGLREIIGRLQEIAANENIQASPAALRIIARESEGGMRDALSLFDQVIAYAGLNVSDEVVTEALGLIDQALIAGMAKAILDGDASRALDLLDQVYNFGFDTKDFSRQVLDYFRALVVVKISREPQKILDLLDAELTELAGVAASASLETLNFHFNAWLDIQERLHRASQPRLLLEALIIRLTQIEPLQPLAELTARLEALMTGLPRGGSPSGGSASGTPSPGPDSHGLAASFSPEYSSSAAPAPAPVRSEPARVAQPAAPWTGPHDVGSFMNMVRAECPLQARFLDHAEIREFGPEQVLVAFAQKSMADLVDRAKIINLLETFFGRRPRLEIIVVSDAAAAPVSAQGTEREDLERRKEEILNHPLVKEARQILPGEVLEVKPEN